jgi:hypothetical protein
MAHRGIHFALTEAQSKSVLTTKDDRELLSIVDAIEDEWDEEYLAQSDKAWDAIHRCLTDGFLLYENGTYPLNHCICGGQQLYQGEDYTVSFISKKQAKDVAASLSQITESWFRERYFAIPKDDYSNELCDDDFEYTWEWFQEVKRLYNKASIENRTVIFTVDC